MMDEVWSRGWAEAHKAALQAHTAIEQEGRPAPTLWDDVRRLMRDLVKPSVAVERGASNCDAQTCQSAA